jgi:hypothetical protein
LKGCASGIHEASTPTLGGFCICEGCGLPFLYKGIPANSRNCKSVPPHTRLQTHPHASLPPLVLPVSRPALQHHFASSSLAFLPPLTITGHHRAVTSSPASLQDNTKPGSSAAQALMDIMRRSPEGEDKWLLTKISNFNVPVKHRSFPKEASSTLRDTLDCTLSMALSLHGDSPMALSAYSLFILFYRLLLRPLPTGCHSRFADAAQRKRCELLLAGEVQRLLMDSNEAQADWVRASTNSASFDSVTFSKTARATILTGAGQVGRACKVAFTYGLETDPAVAAEFLKKLTLQDRHPLIAHTPKRSSPRRI